MAYTALLDACVLYSAPLRDILLRLALADSYRVKWSADIHEEWMRNLAINRPDLSKVSIERLRDKMDAHGGGSGQIAYLSNTAGTPPNDL